MDRRRNHSQIGKKIVRVAAMKERIEEPTIAEGVGTFDPKQSLGAIIGRVDGIEVEGNAYLRLGREMRTQARYR